VGNGLAMPPKVVIRVLLAAFACVVFFAVTAVPATAITRKEQRLLTYINKARAAHGKRKLRVASGMQSGAHNWAVYLQRYNVFYHGRLALSVTENIGWLTCRDGWARSLVRMWLQSPGHRANLLDGSARYVGVGVSTGSYAGWRCTRMSVARFR
jgi:uncharacterized protein YkwD